MKKINYNEIVTPEKMEGAFINQEFIGFPEDYSVIHCLLKEWEPKNIFEICRLFYIKSSKLILNLQKLLQSEHFSIFFLAFSTLSSKSKLFVSSEVIGRSLSVIKFSLVVLSLFVVN